MGTTRKTKEQPQPKHDWKTEPEGHVASRSGCKVSWKVYDNRKLAEAASKVAEHNARIDESLGYDFGYCSPGSIAEYSSYDPRIEALYPDLAGKPGPFFEVCFS